MTNQPQALALLLEEKDQEILALMRDRLRLDWIESNMPLSLIKYRASECIGDIVDVGGEGEGKTLRLAVDAAMEAKNG